MWSNLRYNFFKMVQELDLVPKEKNLQKLTQTENHPIKSMGTPIASKKDLPCDKIFRLKLEFLKSWSTSNQISKKAKGLLKSLSQYDGDVLFWKDNGKLIYKGNVIEGWHISVLLKKALTPCSKELLLNIDLSSSERNSNIFHPQKENDETFRGTDLQLTCG